MNTIAQMSDEAILAAVTPLMDNLMAGSSRIDYPQHTRDFTERMKAQISPERLETICLDYQARIGFFGKREVVGLFRRAASVAVVWRQWTSGSSDEFVAEGSCRQRHLRSGFGAAKPARTAVPVSELHHGYLVEIEAIAARS